MHDRNGSNGRSVGVQERTRHSRSNVPVCLSRSLILSKLYENGGVSRLLVAQLIACSSATATMLEEAKAAESDADFISKCCISLKECRESWTSESARNAVSETRRKQQISFRRATSLLRLSRRSS